MSALHRRVQEGSISRQKLLGELIKLGLDEQKRWKAIRLVKSGKKDIAEAARVAGLDEESFRELLE